MNTVKRRTTLKLPDDFLGNVQKFLNTPPPPKNAKRKAKKRKAKR